MRTDNLQLHYDHEEAAELLGAYALGAVSADEAAALERHLASCDICRAELAELSSAVAALPLLAEELEPPPGLRSRIEAIGRPEAAASAADEPRGGKVVPFYRRPALSWLAAAVLLFAVVGMGAWNMRLRDQLHNQMVAMAVKPMTSEPVQATIIYIPEHHMVVFDAQQLPPLQPGQVYEMWLIQNNNPVPAGVFSSPSTQQAMTVDLHQYQVFALTVEQGPNGTQQPTGQPFAVASLTS